MNDKTKNLDRFSVTLKSDHDSTTRTSDSLASALAEALMGHGRCVGGFISEFLAEAVTCLDPDLDLSSAFGDERIDAAFESWIKQAFELTDAIAECRRLAHEQFNDDNPGQLFDDG